VGVNGLALPLAAKGGGRGRRSCLGVPRELDSLRVDDDGLRAAGRLLLQGLPLWAGNGLAVDLDVDVLEGDLRDRREKKMGKRD